MIAITLITLLIVAGILLGVRMIQRGAAKAAASGQLDDSATTADRPEARAAIEQWAGAHGYQRVEPAADLIRYQKHVGATSGNPTYLDVRHGDGHLTLASYMGVIHPFTRQPGGQMPLSTPGLVLAFPRKTARREHNVLRAALGLPAID